MQEKIRKKWFFFENYVYAFILAILPQFHVTKGVDFTDTGYSIMLFQNSGSHFSYWMLSTHLANRVGALLMKLPGGDTYIGIKVYCLLLLGGMAVGLYLFLSKFFPHRFVFLGMVLALCVRWCPGVVLYNYLSYLLYYAAVILLVTACSRENQGLFFAAGVLLGINVFTRISNVTEVILILPVIFWSVIRKQKIKETAKTVLTCVLGFLTGAGSIGGVIAVKYGLNAYIRMIKSLMGLSDIQDNYSQASMLTAIWDIIRQYRIWLVSILAIVVVFSITARLCKAKRMTYINALASVVAVLVWLRYAHYWSAFSIHDYTRTLAFELFMVVFVMVAVIVSLGVILSKKRTPELRVLAMINLCTLFIAPLGTNTGFLAVINNMYYVLPVTFGMLGLLFFSEKKKYVLPVKAVSLVLFTVTLLQCGLFAVNHVYGAAKASELKTGIAYNDTLRGAQVLEGMEPILTEITEYVYNNELRGKKCITFGNIPLMAFALDMSTALSTSWPDLNSYSIENLREELRLVQEEKPVIILNKWYFFGKDIFNEEIWRDLPKTKVMADYMTDHGYQLTFENDKFWVYEGL